jgi:hypothetical protein
MITAYSSVDLTGSQTLNAVATGSSALVDGQSDQTIFTGVSMMFEITGKENVLFNTPAPITFTTCKAWFGEDYGIGQRSVAHFELWGSTESDEQVFQLFGMADLKTPYNHNYGSDNVLLTLTLPPTTAQYFKIVAVGHDWGLRREGGRINAFALV